MTNYYAPISSDINLTNHTINTYWYVPYTNTLSVTIAGPPGMPSPVSWSVTSPSEWTNSSAYQASPYGGNYAIAPIPTGRYTVVFSEVPGYVKPANITNLITLASPLVNSITGTYTLAAITSSTLTVRFAPTAVPSDVRPTAQWWVDNITFPLPQGPYGNNYAKTLAVPDDYTVIYGSVPGYYKPADTQLNAFSNNLILTNTYLPYTNSLIITMIDDRTNAIGAPWTITSYPGEFTNSTAYIDHGVTGAGYTAYGSVPTGTYVVAYNSMAGYYSPVPSTQAVAVFGAATGNFTGLYTRAYGSIMIDVSPSSLSSNVPWTIVNPPADYAGPLGGTGTTTISNVPAANYLVRFGDISGYQNTTAPNPVPGTVSINATTRFTGTYTSSGFTLILHIAAPYSKQDEYLGAAGRNGIGAGNCRIAASTFNSVQSSVDQTYTIGAGDQVTLTALPAANSYVYKWYVNSGWTLNNYGPTAIDSTRTLINPFSFTMDRSREVWLLLSKSMYDYDNVGDIDQDGLPDRWEIYWFESGGAGPLYGGPAENAKADSGYARNDNRDVDFIPGKYAGYPLSSSRLVSLGSVGTVLGYGSGDKFDNYLECRGLDGYYLTNVPSGGPAYASPYGDDPLTDPLNDDTDEDTMTDGWEYYFWYWRSASAFSAGVTNSADLAWVNISPADTRYPFQTGAEFDTDGDGLDDNYPVRTVAGKTFLGEYLLGTDPTHCDTDGDRTDDFWELDFDLTGTSINALDFNTAALNPDGDYMARAVARKHDQVYMMPPAAPFPGVTSFDPRTAWNHTNDLQAHPNTVPYTTYEEYLGGDLLGRITWNAGGQMTSINDNPLGLNRNSYTDPNKIDTDGDTIEDGWELYVGLNPNAAADAGLDPDLDLLFNMDEWANVYLGPYANLLATVGPTDPGVLTAPAPNDPHPRDTDWDGLDDTAERAANSNPTSADTDLDLMPDGWEVAAGANVLVPDAAADIDGDGLENYQEYLTGAVPEWQLCEGSWRVNFISRRPMPWDAVPSFMPPDFLTCGSFIFNNGVLTNAALLRTQYPAAMAGAVYSTAKASNPDSDGDGMDDYWEVYHGLNPCKGLYNMMLGGALSYRTDVDDVDADTNRPGFQIGTRTGGAFTNLAMLVNLVRAQGRGVAITNIIGPFNFGLQQMDPDGDGLPNLEEYSYNTGSDTNTRSRTFYHTDPSPIWRTDSRDASSFVNFNYYTNLNPGWPYMFRFEEQEGFDNDNDGVGDFAEINAAAGESGNNPLDERNPLRNRALYVNGTTDFVRTPNAWTVLSESNLTRFCVEAWVKPDNPALGDQVVLEKAGIYRNPYGLAMVRANFRLGITNGLPYVMYNGRGSLGAPYQATARIYKLTPGVWAHIAGVYDGVTLTLYVNGEFSMSLPTTEQPATGVNSPPIAGIFYDITVHSIMIGARDLTCGLTVPAYTPAYYFGGCIDEVRIWNGARSQAEVIANMNRRITRSEIKNSALAYYYSFDDVPDPQHRDSAGVLDEPVAPAGLTRLDTTMSFHPTMGWWAAHPQRSTVYTGLNGSYNYLVSAADHVAHMSMLPPQDDYIHFSTNSIYGTNGPGDYNNFSNPYEIPVNAGRSIITDMFMFLGARGVATNSWLHGLDPLNPDSTDIDGDGLPDWWEQLYGLDPNDATGDNGTWGDPDHDGLNNRAEYLAGTDPFNSDTYGTGVGDYDYHPGPYTRTLGEMYTDGDGMPDVWESQNGLDPQKYDANLDLDGDGWSNYQEFMAGTAPNSAASYPRPRIAGLVSYYGNKSGTVRVFGYHTNAMDGAPQTYQYGLDNQVSEVVGYADGTLTFSGVLPFAPVEAGKEIKISAIMYWAQPSGLITYSYIVFTFTGPTTFAYEGQNSGAGADGKLDYNTGEFTLTWARDEVPYRGNEVSVSYEYIDPRFPRFSIAGFKEGDVYLMAYMDLNNDIQWNVGEPLGIAQDVPVNLKWSNISDVRIQLLDNAPGFGRFTWTGAALTNAYPVIINKISESGAPTILRRSVAYPRNYFHEWDFQLAGIEGLMAGTYQWWVGLQNGTFSINWPTSLAKPALVYPRGDMLYNALSQFAWTMDLNCPRARIQVVRGAVGGALVVDKYIRAPWMDNQGICRSDLNEYAGEMTNGVYYWRVAGWTPQGESAWSDWQTFNVSLSATNSRWVSGDIYYFGKAPATRIILEAFNNRGFSGRPVARMTLAPPAGTNAAKCSYTLRGLQQGAYYVRAFLDVTPAGEAGPNNKPDAWESAGFYRDPYNFYQPGVVDLSDVHFMDNAKIIIRDKDTDNDELPDAWEMYYFGNLDQTGDMDYDGDGETNLDEYIKDGVNQNPASWDSDGDGLADRFESRYNGAAFGFALSAKTVRATLNPTAWDTDGDGYSDGAELLRYHTDPLDPTSYPRYRPLCMDAWSSPGDYDGDGRSDIGVYDSSAGVWSYITMAGQSRATPFGFNGAQPMVGDYNGDGRSELAFYDKGLWDIFVLNGQSGSMQFGDASMLPVPADYTGDGRVDLAVFDTDSGIWYIYDAWSGQLMTGKFGEPGMIPVPGDYNGDGVADVAVYEPATGKWSIGCLHKYDRTWTILRGQLGGPTWMPVPGDIDGDGRNDACLFEESTGRWMLGTMAGKFLQGTFGYQGCVPVPGDYDGDGRTDLAVYDKNTGVWYIYCWSGAYYQGSFGGPGALPILKGR